MSDWGQGSKNNDIGWGQGAVNNDISWGAVHANSWAGDTEIVGFAYDSTYQAVLDYATTQGYTLPSDSQKLLQNQLLIDLKTAGVWNKLDSFANFATDGSSNFALIDWKRLSLYTAINSPTFTTNQGFKGNGTSSYINANFNQNDVINYSLNSASIGVYCYTPATSTNRGYFAGIGSNTGIRNTSTTVNRINTNLSSIIFDFNKIGLQSLNRNTSTYQQYISNGVITNNSVNSTSFFGDLVFLSQTPGVDLSNSIISFGFLGGDLSLEAEDFYNITNNYINAL